MARIRTIKPEFWTDEVVVELDYADRLLFIGLWNFADDQGYLPMRPKRIKMQIFPGDDYDVVAGLKRLWESSLVTLYASPEGLLVHVTKWSRHQKISNPAREKYSPSDLRKQDAWGTTVQSPLDSYPAEGKGRERKGRDSCSSADAESVTDPFDDWWSAYPRKKGKGQAPLLGAKGEFCPYPATWLNGERWADEPDVSNVHYLPGGEIDPSTIVWPGDQADWMGGPQR